MNTSINFEIAKLLKEKGFDKICHNLWYFNGSDCIKMINKNSENFGFSAPTVAEVVMWSFNTHKIWIAVDININGKFNYLLRQFNSKDKAWEVKNPSSIQEYFNNPDDAYSSGITYFLNNLEMSK